MHVAFYDSQKGAIVGHEHQPWDKQTTVMMAMVLRERFEEGEALPSSLAVAWDDKGPGEYMGLFDLDEGFFPVDGFLENLEAKVRAFHDTVSQ